MGCTEIKKNYSTCVLSKDSDQLTQLCSLFPSLCCHSKRAGVGIPKMSANFMLLLLDILFKSYGEMQYQYMHNFSVLSIYRK